MDINNTLSVVFGMLERGDRFLTKAGYIYRVLTVNKTTVRALDSHNIVTDFPTAKAEAMEVYPAM